VKRYLADLREGCRIIVSREFWDAFRDYWSWDAIAERVDEWAKRTGP